MSEHPEGSSNWRPETKKRDRGRRYRFGGSAWITAVTMGGRGRPGKTEGDQGHSPNLRGEQGMAEDAAGKDLPFRCLTG